METVGAQTLPYAAPDVPADTDGIVAAPPDVVIAFRSRVNAESITWCLSAYGTFRNIGCATSIDELINIIRAQRPSLVVIGERLVSEGVRVLFSELAIKMGETRVAAFADDLTDRQLDLLVNNRIGGMLSRNESVRDINDLLIRMSGGERILSSALRDRIELSRDGEFRCLGSSHLERLTDRQWDVLLRIAEGRRVSEVASDLRISAKAVESHKYRIMKTLGATDRVGLCRWAIREGLIDP